MSDKNWTDNIEGEVYIFDDYHRNIYSTRMNHAIIKYIGTFASFNIREGQEHQDRVAKLNIKLNKGSK